MALYCSPDYQKSYKSIGLSVKEKKFNDIDFGGGGGGGGGGRGASWISNQNVFSNFLSTTNHLDTSNKVQSQLALLLRRRKSK